jgi:hypothetical protein
MRMMQHVVTGAVALAVLLASAGPAAAIRASCDDLVWLSQAGRSVERIAQDYGTTRARVAACVRLAQQNDRFAARREHFNLQRDARGLAH